MKATLTCIKKRVDKPDVWLQVGLNRREQLIHISESPRGDDCGLRCPHCHGELTAKKGRIKVHHFAHLTNTCRPPMPRFDFWATGDTDNTLSLDDFAKQYQKQLLHEQVGLKQELDHLTQDWEAIKERIGELLVTLERISKPRSHGARPANRQVNHEVLLEVQDFIESITADRGPVPALYKVRHSGFKQYKALFLKKDRWGGREYMTDTVYPSQLWEKAMHYPYIIPASLEPHYNALATYHQTYNERGDVSKEVETFERMYERFQLFSFYFLRINLGTGVLYKSGITSRPLGERLKEIEQDLRPLQLESIVPIAVVPQAAYLESFFKRKYAPFSHLLTGSAGPLTEYFDLLPDTIEEITAALHRLSGTPYPASMTRSDKIRTGMRRRQAAGIHIGRPKVAEQQTQFLQKPKSAHIATLLQAGHSLREIERQTGYSINTIRKVNETLKPPTYHLADLFLAKRADRGFRAVADEINALVNENVASPSALLRVHKGYTPAPDLLNALCQWLGILPTQLKASKKSKQMK